jgi:hypothetical protein
METDNGNGVRANKTCEQIAKDTSAVKGSNNRKKVLAIAEKIL